MSIKAPRNCWYKLSIISLLLPLVLLLVVSCGDEEQEEEASAAVSETATVEPDPLPKTFTVATVPALFVGPDGKWMLTHINGAVSITISAPWDSGLGQFDAVTLLEEKSSMFISCPDEGGFLSADLLSLEEIVHFTLDYVEGEFHAVTINFPTVFLGDQECEITVTYGGPPESSGSETFTFIATFD